MISQGKRGWKVKVFNWRQMLVVLILGRSGSVARTEACTLSNLNFAIKGRLAWLLHTSNRKPSSSSFSFLSYLTLWDLASADTGCAGLQAAAAAAAVWQLLSLFIGTLTFRRQLRRSYSTARHTRGWCGTPTCNTQAAAHFLHKATVDARRPDVTGKDGCLAWGECRTLSSRMRRLISRFHFYCKDSRCLRKCMHSHFAAIHKDILQFYIKGLCVYNTLSSRILYHLH